MDQEEFLYFMKDSMKMDAKHRKEFAARGKFQDTLMDFLHGIEGLYKVFLNEKQTMHKPFLDHLWNRYVPKSSKLMPREMLLRMFKDFAPKVDVHDPSVNKIILEMNGHSTPSKVSAVHGMSQNQLSTSMLKMLFMDHTDEELYSKHQALLASGLQKAKEIFENKKKSSRKDEHSSRKDEHSSSKFTVGTRVRVTSHGWLGICAGKIDVVNPDHKTYKITFDDGDVIPDVEEENMFAFVEKWDIKKNVLVRMQNWEDSFVGVIKSANLEKQSYCIYFDEDQSTEDDVPSYSILDYYKEKSNK